MRTRNVLCLTILTVLAAGPVATKPGADLVVEVKAAETAFAKTMADRDLAAFRTFVSDEAVFFTGKGVLRGADAVAAGWAPLFDGPAAPFSWEPEEVEVLASGKLAFSSGPVRDPQGRRVGTFNSVWRRGPDGGWKVVFDKGCPPCPACDRAGG